MSTATVQLAEEPWEEPPRPAEVPVIDLLLLASIEEDPNQPRKVFQQQALEELAVNIETTAGESRQPWIDGLLHPINVYSSPAWSEGSPRPRWRLLTGARRLRTYRLRGWPVIPAQVRPVPESPFQVLVMQLNENLGREETSLWEDAVAIEQALGLWRFENPQGKNCEFARALGRSPAWVSHRLMLARATGGAKQALIEKRIASVEVYRSFVRLAEPVQIQLLERVRRTRELITPSLLRPLLPREREASRRSGPGEPARESTASVPTWPLGVTITEEQARYLLFLLSLPIPEESRELADALARALSKIEL